MVDVHKTAIIGKDVVLGRNVTIHPYAVLDGRIKVGDGCEIGPFVHITGWVEIGEETRIYSHASIGEHPQDYGFDGTPGLVKIGSRSIIREAVTIHTPVHGDEGTVTQVGDEVMLMVNAHVAHNVQVGDRSVVANNTPLAGYVEVGHDVFISGNCGVHQFCRIGSYAMVGVLTRVTQDVPPFVLVNGPVAETRGLNSVGLRRKGFSSQERSILKDAYKAIYSGRDRKLVYEELLQKYPNDTHVKELVTFCQQATKRGIVGAHHNA